jgi:hypothetical protein
MLSRSHIMARLTAEPKGFQPVTEEPSVTAVLPVFFTYTDRAVDLPWSTTLQSMSVALTVSAAPW